MFLEQWTSASVEKRELAGKLAKLNAIELAKLSRRVSGEIRKSYWFAVAKPYLFYLFFNYEME